MEYLEKGLLNMNSKLKEARYIMEVEWDGKPGSDIDYAIWCHDDLDWLIEKFTTGKEKGFEVSVGSCPNISILSVKDTQNGENITEVIQTIIKERKGF